MQFSYDISDALNPEGENELIVGVYDPTNHAGKASISCILLKIRSALFIKLGTTPPPSQPKADTQSLVASNQAAIGHAKSMLD